MCVAEISAVSMLCVLYYVDVVDRTKAIGISYDRRAMARRLTGDMQQLLLLPDQDTRAQLHVMCGSICAKLYFLCKPILLGWEAQTLCHAARVRRNEPRARRLLLEANSDFISPRFATRRKARERDETSVWNLSYIFAKAATFSR